MVKIGRSESRLVFSVKGKRARERGNHVPLCTFFKMACNNERTNK